MLQRHSHSFEISSNSRRCLNLHLNIQWSQQKIQPLLLCSFSENPLETTWNPMRNVCKTTIPIQWWKNPSKKYWKRVSSVMCPLKACFFQNWKPLIFSSQSLPTTSLPRMCPIPVMWKKEHLKNSKLWLLSPLALASKVLVHQ
uniref:ORF142 n=1 Tax=Human herpesvirus 6B TaxID=32604 RepID=Q8QVP1_HHV6H|nr:ORF142 [Human betaherpesvirus 6B]